MGQRACAIGQLGRSCAHSISSFAHVGGDPISQSVSLRLCEDDNDSDAPIHKKTCGKYFKSCMSYVQPPTWLTLPVSGASILTLFVEVALVAGVATVGGRWRAMRLEQLSSALWLEFKLCSEPYETDTQVASYILCDLARTFGFDAVV